MALARDALSSGNTVTAENYFQHAEHYNRIIQAAQAKQEEQTKSQPSKSMASKPAGSKTGSSRQARSNDRRPRAQADSNETPAKISEVPIPGTGDQPSVNGNGGVSANEPGEEKPKRKPRVRKPKLVKKESEDGNDNKDEPNNIGA